MPNVLHSRATGVHPGAYVQATAPANPYSVGGMSHALPDGVLWVDTSDIGSDDMPRTVQTVTADTTLTSGNLFVLVPSGTVNITLPDPAITTGQAITVKTTGGSYTMKNPDGTPADNATQSPWNGMSDGTHWWNVDY